MTFALTLLLAATQATVITHYSIALPEAYQLKDVSPPLMDFNLYEVIATKDGKTRCTLYLGNAPSFPTLRWKGAATESAGSGRRKKELRSGNRLEGLITFSGLTYRSGGTPFSTIHYVTNRLSGAEAKVIETMLTSIVVVEPHLR